MTKAKNELLTSVYFNIIIGIGQPLTVYFNIHVNRPVTDCALECERLVENEPDSDHLDQNSPVAERVAERCQPGVNLKTIEIVII